MTASERTAAYAELADAARQRCSGLDMPARMQLVSDLVWQRLGSHTKPGTPHAHGRPYSWIGFYKRQAVRSPAPPVHGDQIILVACRDKPACSPIGMHGACGRCCTAQHPLLVDDVSTLGDSYVACDPHDVSEIVVPCLDESGACYAVIDGDSFDRAAFDQT
ncbi:MAG: hypothetical protein DRR04_12300, partial [Gammaproteobacteria bacterium]